MSETAKQQNNDEKGEEESESKLIRILTVLAYLFSVSFGAIVLSLYYIFLWDPKVPDQQRLKST
jgi:hypothetical protein